VQEHPGPATIELRVDRFKYGVVDVEIADAAADSDANNAALVVQSRDLGKAFGDMGQGKSREGEETAGMLLTQFDVSVIADTGGVRREDRLTEIRLSLRQREDLDVDTHAVHEGHTLVDRKFIERCGSLDR
jgi:hypothetical protein